MGLAGFLPNLCYLAHPLGKPVRRQPPPPAPVCLEAWVRLRSYRGCPVLAASNGYRLGIYCFPGGCPGAAGSSNGALVFAGPFPGRAYISERPVPLGRWVHLAGLDAGPGWPASAMSAIQSIVAIDGIDVTAGRMAGRAAGPLALGYDPWEARMQSAKAARAARAAMAPRASGYSMLRLDSLCAGIPGPPDGERGAWRWSRAWRDLSQVAAGRGSPWHVLPLAPSALTRPEALRMPGSSDPGGITPRGWRILASGVLLALAMVGAGIALRRLDGGEAPHAGPLARTEE